MLNNKDEREDFYETIFILFILVIIAGAIVLAMLYS